MILFISLNCNVGLIRYLHKSVQVFIPRSKEKYTQKTTRVHMFMLLSKLINYTNCTSATVKVTAALSLFLPLRMCH